MRRILNTCLAVLFASSLSWGQDATCVQKLRLAQSTYEQGRLHELPGMLEGCLASGFNKEEKRQAYQLLTMAYIYLEEPEKADDTMLKLLQTDHFFKPNENVDPAEFISLYNKFRTKSIFRAGLRLGPGVNLSAAMKDYYVATDSRATGKYTPAIGFAIGLTFEKDLLGGKLIAAPEFNRVGRGFGESSTTFLSDFQKTQEANNEQILKIVSYELNPIVKYKLTGRADGLETYAMLGPGVSFVGSATFSEAKLDRLDGSGTNTGPDVIVTSSFKRLNYSVIGGAGARLRLGPVYLLLNARLQYGLSNIVNSRSRSNPEVVFDYATTFNDSRLTSLTVDVGILYAYFSPKKLIK